MGRLLVLFFLLPWWGYIPASLGVLWLGERVYEQALATEAEKAVALEGAAPAPVDLADFDRARDIHVADEVYVTARIDPEITYELVKKRNGITTGTRQMYMMFGSGDATDAHEVRAALILTPEERARLLEGDTLKDYIVSATDKGDPVFAFNGFADAHDSFGSLAADAIEEQGLSMSKDFIFIAPFFEGREAALAPRGIPEQSRYIGWAIAAVVALIGVVKRVRSVRARPAHDPEAAAEAVEADAPERAPAMSAPTDFDLPDSVAADSPLGRLARRRPENAVVGIDAPAAFVPQEDIDPMPDTADPTDETLTARPRRSAPIYDSGSVIGGGRKNPFPPVPEIGSEAAAARSGSAVGFYVKLALAMLVVGGIAYDPSIIDLALPFASVALFWLGVYVVFQKIRRGGERIAGRLTPAPKHRRRPEGAAQQVAAGVGGHRVDLTSPVHAAGRHETGVI